MMFLGFIVLFKGDLQFPTEYSDTQASKKYFDQLKQELYKKYLLRPKGKRVDYLKMAFLCPFYFPFRSLLSLHLSDSNTDFSSIEYFILRDKNVIEKFNTLFLSNKQITCDVFANEDSLNKSYAAVRLTCLNKGSFEKFSLLYACKPKDINKEKNETEKEKNKLAVQKLITEYQSEFLAKSNVLSEKQSNKQELKKRLKNKHFDKFQLLINEKAFHTFEMELNDSSQHNKPIGFVTTNEFTLVKGTCTANAFVLTKYFLDLLNSNSNNVQNRAIVNYKIPNCHILRQARINHFIN